MHLDPACSGSWPASCHLSITTFLGHLTFNAAIPEVALERGVAASGAFPPVQVTTAGGDRLRTFVEVCTKKR